MPRFTENLTESDIEEILAPQQAPQPHENRAARILTLLGLDADTRPSLALDCLTYRLGVPRLEKTALAHEFSQLSQSNRLVTGFAVQGFLLALRAGKRQEALQIVDDTLREDQRRVEHAMTRLRLQLVTERASSIARPVADFGDGRASNASLRGFRPLGTYRLERVENGLNVCCAGVLDTAAGALPLVVIDRQGRQLLSYRIPGDEEMTQRMLSGRGAEPSLSISMMRTLLQDTRVTTLDVSFREVLSAVEYRAASYLRTALRRDNAFFKLEELIGAAIAPAEFDRVDLRPLHREITRGNRSVRL